MSDQDEENSPMRTQASHRNATNNESIEDTFAANNSIIGKVKSRVSSIFPNSLSKWFSPSTKNNNDSLNGSISINTDSNLSRRRRRIEVDDDEEEEEEDEDEEVDDDEDDENDSGDFDDNLFALEPDRNDDDEAEDDDDDGDDNSEESNNSDLAVTTATKAIKQSHHGDMRTSTAVRQPPTKRSRLNLDHTFTTKSNRNTPFCQRQPIVSSTPDVGGGTLSNQFSPASRTTNRYTHLNLYGNQTKKEPGYNFSSSPVVNATGTSMGSPRFDPDIIDLIPEQAVDSNAGDADLVSSRRSLNIPATTTHFSTTERYSTGLSNLKRQSLASVKNEITSSSLSTLPKRTSTTIYETDTSVGSASLHGTPPQLRPQRQHQPYNNLETNAILEEQEEDFPDNNEVIVLDELDELQKSKKCNGETTQFKRQKLSNGAGLAVTHSKNVPLLTANVHVRDSASESSDGGGGGKAEILVGSTGGVLQRKTAGLFNISASNSRNGSRTSSFGNGLNFYTHLEGRKSLFSGGAGPQAGTSGGTPLNNSTLSLSSLNRRQFNASLYGSTSALSDSRLLNTFSPFYKGKTTYGGAAAYNKYSMSGTSTGAGASAVRITPTLIRPTSSLSTLSSSNNSTSAGGVHMSENPSAISSTAKRILDLINDFATPLSEAKKMASNLKSSQLQQQQSTINQSLSKTQRFNETDLMATRAMRLSQVRTPYSRPSVTLIPNAANNCSTSLPPVRELQVPSMSQLLQMKKMQQTTERSRKIAAGKSNFIGCGQGAGVSAEYCLPSDLDAAVGSIHSQKQHTNKIKNKVTRSGRAVAIKDSTTVCDIASEPTSAPVNLPNIAFPLMQSVPKFDINLLPSTKSTKPTTMSTVKSVIDIKDSRAADSQSKAQLETLKQTSAETGPAIKYENKAKTSTVKEFTFSTPLQVGSLSTRTQIIAPISDNYKFSAPLIVERNAEKQEQTQFQQKSEPQLKTGSVLDALKKPFTLPSTIPTSSATSTSTLAGSDSVLAQFKKSSNEWECDTCMIRNKVDVSKCVACETPRKFASSSASEPPKPISVSTPTIVFGNFGNQFKKSSSEWECDTCMIRNKADISRCVACETLRKQPANTNIESIKPSFGDAFKPKANTWECSTCLINNKTEANECVACQTQKPGSTLKQVTPILPPVTDAGFKSLATAQKASKWECEACMTRNDSSKLKCVCCEQAKPGTMAVSENVPKFNFGSTAAAKFSFGFGNQNSPKEEELRKMSENEKLGSSKPSPKPAVGFSFDSSSKLTPTSTVTSGGFTFGIKPIVPVETTSKLTNVKDAVSTMSTVSTMTTTTAAPVLSGFRFGVGDKSATSNTLSPASASTTKAGFVFGSTKPPITTTTTKTTEVTTGEPKSSGFTFKAPTSVATTSTANSIISLDVNSSSSKYAPSNNSLLPFGATQSSTTVSASSSTITNKTSENSESTVKFTVPTTSNASSSLDNKLVNQSNATSIFGTSAAQESRFKATQQPGTSTGFSFGVSTSVVDGSNSQSIASTLAITTATTVTSFSAPPITTASSGAKYAPSTNSMVIFGTAAGAVTTGTGTAASNTSTKPSSAGFSFGSISAVGSASSTTTLTKPSLFGVTPTTTITSTTVSIVPAMTTQPTSIFGSFGTVSTTGNSIFGATNSANANSSSSTTTSTFGTLAATSASTSPFGTFGNANSNTASSKTNTAASTPLFGSTAVSSSTAPFSFGTSNNVSTTTSAVTSTTVSSSTTWPKNNFVFGSSSSTTVTSAGSTTHNDAAKPAAFGTTAFGTSLTQPAVNNTSSSIFGSNPQASGTSSFAAAATFGSVVPSTPIFGASSTPASASSGQAPSNIFGSSSGATNIIASSSTPVFGSSPFGGSSTATAAVVAPSFGNAASSVAASGRASTTNTFGGFGATAVAANNSDGASAAKKSEPAFNFGATPVAPQAQSGGFNFGSGAPAAKPAFNFGAATGTTANFNFTGANTEIPKSSQPFQFGATTQLAVPVFNFSGVASEQTPNTAPFQFNAGSAQPIMNNIFAPTPTPAGSQGALQARRKIRPPMRRLTPR